MKVGDFSASMRTLREDKAGDGGMAAPLLVAVELCIFPMSRRQKHAVSPHTGHGTALLLPSSPNVVLVKPLIGRLPAARDDAFRILPRFVSTLHWFDAAAGTHKLSGRTL